MAQATLRPLTRLTAIAAPLPLANVDTDQLLPARLRDVRGEQSVDLRVRVLAHLARVLPHAPLERVMLAPPAVAHHGLGRDREAVRVERAATDGESDEGRARGAGHPVVARADLRELVVVEAV